MKEVEISVEVAESKASALKKLSKFKSEGVKNIHDIYFCDPDKEDVDISRESILDNSFRLRKKGDKSFLTYKIKRFDDKGRWIYSDEYETEVLDYENAKKIIERLGFKPLVEIKNERHIFLKNNYEIVLEDVKDLGLFMEVEALNLKENADVSRINKEILSFINSLGIKLGKELNFGKPELMLKKKVLKK